MPRPRRARSHAFSASAVLAPNVTMRPCPPLPHTETVRPGTSSPARVSAAASLARMPVSAISRISALSRRSMKVFPAQARSRAASWPSDSGRRAFSPISTAGIPASWSAGMASSAASHLENRRTATCRDLAVAGFRSASSAEVNSATVGLSSTGSRPAAWHQRAKAVTPSR